MDVRLIDFDIAYPVHHVAPTEARPSGSLGFMAPETIDGTVTDRTRADVWATGCVLMELVSGTDWFHTHWLGLYRRALPQRASSPFGLDMADRLPALVKTVHDACEDVRTQRVLTEALRVDPVARPSSVELLAQLRSGEGSGVTGPT